MTESPAPAIQNNPLITAAAVVVIVAGMKVASPIVVPLLVSIFIAVLCAPVVNALVKIGVPLWPAIGLVCAGTVVAAIAVAGIIGNSINNFTQDLPQYHSRVEALESQFRTWLEQHDIRINPLVDQRGIDPGRLLQFTGRIMNGISAMFGNVTLILLTVIFLLIEAPTFFAKLDALPGSTEAHQQRLARILDDVRQYMSIKTWISFLTALAVVGLLKWVGVDYALMWGVVAFFLNFVPSFGSIIAAVPAVLLTVIQLGVWPAVYVSLGYTAINWILGNFLEPRVMGKGLGLSTFVVFASLVFWGWVLGPVGMVLSVPLTMIVKIFLEGHESTHWIAVMLGSEVPEQA